MKPTRVKQLLSKLLLTRWPVFLWGPPGIGKSSIVAETAREMDLDILDVRAALLDPTDIRGIPTVENGATRWCQPAFLPSDEESKGVLFLDELNAAPPLVQASLYQLTLDRRIGEYLLPEGWRIVAAGNRARDGGITFRMPSPLANRFIHAEVEADLQDWSEWAVRSGVHYLVVGFLNLRPNLLSTPYAGQDAFATPRSWEMLSDLLIQDDADPAAYTDIINGIVGEGAASEFLTYCKNSKQEKVFLKIFENPSAAPLPKKLNEQYALTAWLISKLNNSANRDAVGTLLLRFSPEFGVLLQRGAFTIDARIANHAAFQEFSRKHGAYIV
jgi:hypothetical protein